jgi:molybdopterin converting factor small subunit
VIAVADVTVTIPMLLGNATGGAHEVTASGDTLQACLDDLQRQYPALRTHLYDDHGAQRKHVLILYNDQNTRWFDSLDLPIEPGDRITILQAVSGG